MHAIVLLSYAYYVPLGHEYQVARLHDQAARRVKAASHKEALRIYETATEHGSKSAQSYLLLGLHQQRVGRVSVPREEHDYLEHSRESFMTGVLHNPHDAQLLQAWALLESKMGNMHRSVLLLRRAAHVADDRRKITGVLSWRVFREYLREHSKPHASEHRSLRLAPASSHLCRLSATLVLSRSSQTRSLALVDGGPAKSSQPPTHARSRCIPLQLRGLHLATLMSSAAWTHTQACRPHIHRSHSRLSKRYPRPGTLVQPWGTHVHASQLAGQPQPTALARGRCGTRAIRWFVGELAKHPPPNTTAHGSLLLLVGLLVAFYYVFWWVPATEVRLPERRK